MKEPGLSAVRNRKPFGGLKQGGGVVRAVYVLRDCCGWIWRMDKLVTGGRVARMRLSQYVLKGRPPPRWAAKHQAVLRLLVPSLPIFCSDLPWPDSVLI